MFVYFKPITFTNLKKIPRTLKPTLNYSLIAWSGINTFDPVKKIYKCYPLKDVLADSYGNLNVYFFRKTSQNLTNVLLNLPRQFKSLETGSVMTSINSLLIYNSALNFKKLLLNLFWSVKVTDHRFILLWVRKLWKQIYLNRDIYMVDGISICFKGKLSVTGNKRKRTFYVNYGLSSSTKIKNTVKLYFFTIRTTTGVIGVSISITYNR